jgi:predicted metal-dependent enzyme (double-stranded beta helix superfamily)
MLSARDCAAELIALLDRHPDDLEAVARAAVAPVQRLLARPDLLTLGVERAANHAGQSLYLYYDFDLNITVSSLTPGVAIPVHDHGTWELVGVYRGGIRHTLYRRVDDRSTPGEARLEVIEERDLRPPDVVAAIPPLADIHGFTALRPGTYILAVVGGRYKPIRRYYDPESNTYLERPEKAWRLG